MNKYRLYYEEVLKKDTGIIDRTLNDNKDLPYYDKLKESLLGYKPEEKRKELEFSLNFYDRVEQKLIDFGFTSDNYFEDYSFINLSLDYKYLTQRDNKMKPLSTCNTTSFAMALMYNKILPPEKYVENGEQLEDRLTRFITTDQDVLNFYKTRYPKEYEFWVNNKTSSNAIPPNQMHEVLAYGINRFVGKKVVTFTVRGTVLDMIDNIYNKGKVFVTSGVWSGLGHITCIVGMVCNSKKVFRSENGLEILNKNWDNIEYLKEHFPFFIMDDPYGDPYTKYKDTNGNDLIVPVQDIIGNIRTLGSTKNKYMHYFL